MPIVAQFMFGADFKEDGLVEILHKTISELGCVSLLAESTRRGVSAESVKKIFSSMSGVTCDEEKCCVTDLTASSANMKKLAGGE